MRPTTLLATLATLALLGPALVRAADTAASPAGTTAKAPPVDRTAPQDKPVTPETKAPEPEHITIQHVLIGFAGSVPGKNITRNPDEAYKLAHEVLERARKGDDFDALVKQYTDDAAPGIYSMSNTGVAPAQGEYPRKGMVPAFGDAGFPLKVGEFGIAEYDKTRSPYGWHIVKRLK